MCRLSKYKVFVKNADPCSIFLCFKFRFNSLEKTCRRGDGCGMAVEKQEITGVTMLTKIIPAAVIDISCLEIIAAKSVHVMHCSAFSPIAWIRSFVE